MTTITEIRIIPTNKEIFARLPIAQFEQYLTCYQWAKAKLKIDKNGCYELDNEGKKSYVFNLDKEKYSFAVKNGLPLMRQ